MFDTASSVVQPRACIRRRNCSIADTQNGEIRLSKSRPMVRDDSAFPTTGTAAIAARSPMDVRRSISIRSPVLGIGMMACHLHKLKSHCRPTWLIRYDGIPEDQEA